MYKVGIYEREITAFFGCSLRGYFNTRLVDGVKDKTYAKSVVIDDGEKTVVFLSADTSKVSDKTIDLTFEKVKKYIPVKRENFLIASTHSHTACVDAPGVYEDSDIRLDTVYLDFLVEALADTVILACQRLQPATIKFALTNVEGISFVRNYRLKNGTVRTNPGRFNPDIVEPYGENDTDVPVFFFESITGEKLGLMYSFGCHQDCVDGTEVSGDYSSRVSRVMKEKFGMDFISIYFSGAAGNVNNFNVNKERDESDHYYRMGDKIANQIISVLPSLKEINAKIKVGYKLGQYKTRVPDQKEIERQQAIFNKVEIPYGVKLDASSPVELFDACTARSCLKFAQTAPAYTKVPWQVISFGDIMIFAICGETFTQHVKRIKKAFPNKQCVFFTICNYCVGYMPAKDCYLPELYESLYGSCRLEADDMEDLIDKYIELGKTL